VGPASRTGFPCFSFGHPSFRPPIRRVPPSIFTVCKMNHFGARFQFPPFSHSPLGGATTLLMSGFDPTSWERSTWIVIHPSPVPFYPLELPSPSLNRTRGHPSFRKRCSPPTWASPLISFLTPFARALDLRAPKCCARRSVALDPVARSSFSMTISQYPDPSSGSVALDTFFHASWDIRRIDPLPPHQAGPALIGLTRLG